MSVPIIDGLRHLADRYDGFILDLWGVILDGESVFPRAKETLERLQALGKKVVMLSNVPTRSQFVEDLLSTLGIERPLYHEIISSGEAAHRSLTQSDDPWFKALGNRYFLLGEDRFRSVAEGLPQQAAHSIDQADFILNTGPLNEAVSLPTFIPVLDQGLSHKLPMICVNPDLVVVQNGKTLICAGTLARYYEENGGQVRYFGKPDPAIYQTCLDSLAVTDKNRVLAVGDAFHTDVKGARSAGLDVLFCSCGIHAKELGLSYGQPPSTAGIADLITRYGGLRPLAAIPAFQW